MTTSDGRGVVRKPARVRGFGVSICLLPAIAVVVSGCAGSPTPLPDFRDSVAKVLTPQQKDAAMAAIEQRRDAAAQATSAIEKDRTVK